MLAVILVILGTLVYYLLKQRFSYWEKRGVPGPTPRFFVGNVGESFVCKKSIGEVVTDIYNEFDGVPLVGMFKSTTPCIIIRDPDLVKEVTVKEFNSFQDNEVVIDKDVEPLFGRNPFCLKGETWKKVRSQITPCFSSGKMKSLYPIIEDSCQRFMKFIEDKSKGGSVESKELCIHYTLSNVASCAFGLDAKCFEDPNSEFKSVATRFVSPGNYGFIKLFLITLIPALSSFVSIKFTPRDVEEKLQEIVTQTISYRKSNNVVRKDFLNIMLELQKSSPDNDFTMVDIAAHAAGFLGDGFETSAIVMSFFLYELAANPEAQDKLRKEIVERFAANGGSIPYEEIMDMPYMDAAFNESQRLHPALFLLSRTCTSSYTYFSKPGDGISKPSVVIEKGTSVILPILGLQNDPKYYKNPERYTPERFLGKNKEDMVKYTFMPFGEGPRNCLGQRFGTLQVKAGVAYVVKNFQLSVGSKTKVPLKYDPIYFMTFPVGGLWVNFKKI